MEYNLKMKRVIKENKLHIVSGLGKTWIFDLDGTILKHNGYIIDGEDSFLLGAQEFLQSIDKNDMIIFVTSRKLDMKEKTELFLKSNNIRFDSIIYEAPYGERILVNDRKLSGLQTAIAINTTRDQFMEDRIQIDNSL